jgi:L-rhamnono-1,4-lactonase
MPPGMPIAKAQEPSHYLSAAKLSNDDTSNFEVQGFVFIETDVRYDPPKGDVSTWARQPLDEITFVRKIVEGASGEVASRLMLGIVPWAPMDQSPSVLDQYLQLAQARVGQATWKKIKGFRYLLQSIVDQKEFETLVLGDEFISNLKMLGQRGFSFDIGVDQRSGASWQLDAMAQAMELAHADVDENNRVTFIINHLCKPDFSGTEDGFERWCNAISSMSKLSNTYMKLSGAFSELQSQPFLSKPSDITRHLRPWIAHVLKCFGPHRVMFGSDWPVLNLNGPLGEDSWSVWKDLVELILEDRMYDLSDDDKDGVWYKVAQRAYRLC